MIYFLFDLDDTLIIHQKGVPINYNMIQRDNPLSKLLNKCKGECYIYTNGTGNHALDIIDRLGIKDTMHKIYSRDTIPYMKPDERSFIRVQQDLFSFSKKEGIIFFFDDLLENLNAAKKLGWITFWIHPDYNSGSNYSFIDLSFSDIKTCLSYLENKSIN
jgi:FMN phosphatase YigB (HAD superfamily)